MAPLQNLSGKKEGGDGYSGSGRPDSRTRDIANLKQQACQFLKPPRSVSFIFKNMPDILSTSCDVMYSRAWGRPADISRAAVETCVCVCVCVWV